MRGSGERGGCLGIDFHNAYYYGDRSGTARNPCSLQLVGKPGKKRKRNVLHPERNSILTLTESHNTVFALIIIRNTESNKEELIMSINYVNV